MQLVLEEMILAGILQPILVKKKLVPLLFEIWSTDSETIFVI